MVYNFPAYHAACDPAYPVFMNLQRTW